MNTASISLVSILNPPGNPWLKSISRRAQSLPVGVRVVRFNPADTDDDEGILLEPAAKKAKPPPARTSA
jgi:hypothetical protein